MRLAARRRLARKDVVHANAGRVRQIIATKRPARARRCPLESRGAANSHGVLSDGGILLAQTKRDPIHASLMFLQRCRFNQSFVELVFAQTTRLRPSYVAAIRSLLVQLIGVRGPASLACTTDVSNSKMTLRRICFRSGSDAHETVVFSGSDNAFEQAP